jgi:hypothetical protein
MAIVAEAHHRSRRLGRHSLDSEVTTKRRLYLYRIAGIPSIGMAN